MAYSRLARTLSFVGVAGLGGTATLAHGLVDPGGVSVRPDIAWSNAAGFTVTYDSTNVTVTNNNPGVATAAVFVLSLHSGVRNIGSDSDFSVQPFISAGGAGAASADSRIFATDYASQDGVTNALQGIQDWFDADALTTQQAYAPGGGEYLMVYTGGGYVATPLISAGQVVYAQGDGADRSVISMTRDVAAQAVQTTGIVVANTGILRLSDITIEGPDDALTGTSFKSIFGSPEGPTIELMRTRQHRWSSVMEGGVGSVAPWHVLSVLNRYDSASWGLVDRGVSGYARFVCDRFDSSEVAMDYPDGAHCIYPNPGVNLLFLGNDFVSSGNPALSGNSYGIHINSGNGSIARWCVIAANTFDEDVTQQILTNVTCPTMMVGNGHFVGTGGTGVRCLGSDQAHFMVGCSLRGGGNGIDDNNASGASFLNAVGTSWEDESTVSSIYHSGDTYSTDPGNAGYHVWRFLGCSISNTNSVDATTSGIRSNSGVIDVSNTTLYRSPSAPGGIMAVVGIGEFVIRDSRVLSDGPLYFLGSNSAGAGSLLVESWTTRYDSSGVGSGLRISPSDNASIITVRGRDNYFLNGGPSVDKTGAAAATITGFLRFPPNKLSIAAAANLTVTANSDFYVLTGGTAMTNLYVQGGVVAPADGNLIWEGATLTVLVQDGFTVNAGGNFAANAQGAHAGGALLRLTLVNQIWTA